MSAQHTPGPLSVARAKNGCGDHAVIDADHNIVAECCADIRRAGEDAREEALANARLYAAAPDLLDALQYAMPYLKAAVPSPRNGINPDCTQDVNCVDRALAAIAKATGSAS